MYCVVFCCVALCCDVAFALLRSAPRRSFIAIHPCIHPCIHPSPSKGQEEITEIKELPQVHVKIVDLPGVFGVDRCGLLLDGGSRQESRDSHQGPSPADRHRRRRGGRSPQKGQADAPKQPGEQPVHRLVHFLGAQPDRNRPDVGQLVPGNVRDVLHEGNHQAKDREIQTRQGAPGISQKEVQHADAGAGAGTARCSRDRIGSGLGVGKKPGVDDRPADRHDAKGRQERVPLEPKRRKRVERPEDCRHSQGHAQSLRRQ
mmetsp:Transcript_4253/g.12217  ORF Transcript_4253/g.12217 Transcript_4253/m.12217 type:complete len:259 (-) Transcript_4253:482-1258(-)